MIDDNGIVGGDGPMAHTRYGSAPVLELLDYLDEHGIAQAKRLRMKTGGFVDFLGTCRARGAAHLHRRPVTGFDD